MAQDDIPVLVKHCALAIYKGGSIQGNTLEKATAALNIARHRLTEYGFLKKGSEIGEPSKIKLTGKGLQAEAKHRRESDSLKKIKAWDKLYGMIAEVEEESDDDGPMDEQTGLPPGKKPSPAARKKQTQVRRAKVAKRRTVRAGVPRAKKAKRG